jgi:uncharacterized protein
MNQSVMRWGVMRFSHWRLMFYSLMGIVGLWLVLQLFSLLLSLVQMLQSLDTGVFLYGFLAIVAISLLVWKWRRVYPLRCRRTASKDAPNVRQLKNRLNECRLQGVDVTEAEAELRVLDEQRSGGSVYVAFLGEISTGKSSIISALLPDERIKIQVTGGTTQTIDRYVWKSPSGDKLVLSDLPGLQESALSEAGKRGNLARMEALRAHLIVYVVDGDITREQYAVLQEIQRLNKPVILAFNKQDQYASYQQRDLSVRLEQYLDEDDQLVFLNAGGFEELIHIDVDGSESRQQRALPVDLAPLKKAIECVLKRDRELLDRLRDASVFMLTEQKLSTAMQHYRFEASQRCIRQYSRKAMLGGMVPPPGMDLVIEGTLSVLLVKDLCALYEVPMKDLDVRRLVTQLNQQIRHWRPMAFAIVGNVFKAFPGLGTVAGMGVHVIAYGLLFSSLGKALVYLLEQKKPLSVEAVSSFIQEQPREDLEKQVYQLVGVILGKITARMRPEKFA